MEAASTTAELVKRHAPSPEMTSQIAFDGKNVCIAEKFVTSTQGLTPSNSLAKSVFGFKNPFSDFAKKRTLS